MSNIESTPELVAAVYENPVATAEFKKASGVLGGIWEALHSKPEQYLDATTMAEESVDVAAKDFLAGMTDGYAARMYKRLFTPDFGSIGDLIG